MTEDERKFNTISRARFLVIEAGAVCRDYIHGIDKMYYFSRHAVGELIAMVENLLERFYEEEDIIVMVDDARADFMTKYDSWVTTAERLHAIELELERLQKEMMDSVFDNRIEEVQ